MRYCEDPFERTQPACPLGQWSERVLQQLCLQQLRPDVPREPGVALRKFPAAVGPASVACTPNLTFVVFLIERRNESVR